MRRTINKLRSDLIRTQNLKEGNPGMKVGITVVSQ
jgi:hypothetical protein